MKKFSNEATQSFTKKKQNGLFFPSCLLRVSLWKGIFFLLSVACAIGINAQPAEKFAQSKTGMAATGSTYATRAAVSALEAGGNAIDAAAAAWFALIVTDPANTSLGGRAQILLRLANGKIVAIDGATESPATVKPLRDADDLRAGYGVVPVPGGLAAIAEMTRKYGRLSLAAVLKPAIELAESGFVIPPRLAASWQQTRATLARNPGAAQNFLKPDGSAWQAGEVFRQPRLAKTLRAIAANGTAVFYRGKIAAAMARDIATQGGFVQQQDLRQYRAQPGVVVKSAYRGDQVVSAGGRAWGNTLSEMLNILTHFTIGRTAPEANEIEIIARVIAQAMDDRPQEISTLKPKPNGYPLPLISSPQFAAERAEMIRRKLSPANHFTPPATPPDRRENHDTTHLAVIDAAGNAVSLTTSIGPAFGARVATPELGFLYAHSYKMRSDPTPRTRDLTEMTPTIVFRQNQPLLAVGGAGSERIPTAILQVLINVLDRGWSLEQAMRAPRIFCLNNKLRLHEGFSPELIAALRSRGFAIEMVAANAARHHGLVHAVQFEPKTKTWFGAADTGDSGCAAAPSKTLTTKH